MKQTLKKISPWTFTGVWPINLQWSGASPTLKASKNKGGTKVK